MQEAFDTLRILIGATAATTLMHGYVDGASRRPTSAAQAQDLDANPAPKTTNSSTQTSPPPPPKKKRKKSLAKRMQRLNGALERLHVHAAASAEPPFKDSEEANEDTTTESTTEPQAVVHLEAAATDLTTQNTTPTPTLGNTPSASKRSPSRTESSPAVTPSRAHTGKKQRAQHVSPQSQQQRWSRTLVPSAPVANPPPPVALLAQNFARHAIHNSEWYWLAEPEFEHTFLRAVHLISIELSPHNGDHWTQVCSHVGPRIVKEQMTLDGVAMISE